MFTSGLDHRCLEMELIQCFNKIRSKELLQPMQSAKHICHSAQWLKFFVPIILCVCWFVCLFICMFAFLSVITNENTSKNSNLLKNIPRRFRTIIPTDDGLEPILSCHIDIHSFRASGTNSVGLAVSIELVINNGSKFFVKKRFQFVKR